MINEYLSLTLNFLHYVLSHRKGYGTISAAGGAGWGGGGGGRISLDCYSIQEDVKVTVHGLYQFTSVSGS